MRRRAFRGRQAVDEGDPPADDRHGLQLLGQRPRLAFLTFDRRRRRRAERCRPRAAPERALEFSLGQLRREAQAHHVVIRYAMPAALPSTGVLRDVPGRLLEVLRAHGAFAHVLVAVLISQSVALLRHPGARRLQLAPHQVVRGLVLISLVVPRAGAPPFTPIAAGSKRVVHRQGREPSPKPHVALAHHFRHHPSQAYALEIREHDNPMLAHRARRALSSPSETEMRYCRVEAHRPAVPADLEAARAL